MLGKTRILTSEGWITPVASWCATAEDRDDALDRFQSSQIVRELAHRAARQDLLSLYEVVTGGELHAPRAVGDQKVVAAIEEALFAGKLLLVPGWSPSASGETRSTKRALASEDGRLVAAVMGDEGALDFEGQKFRLVALDGAPLRPSGRSDFRPVAATQARDILKRMSARVAKTPEQRASFERLVDKVSDGHAGAGVVLTREERRPSPKVIETPVAALSEVLPPKVTKQDWVEIEIAYEDGSPFDGHCAIELPGGRRTDQSPSSEGIVRVDGLDPGNCELSLPDLDANAFDLG